MTEFELNKFKIEHIFTYSIDVDAKMFIQKLPTGSTRVTGVITGGKVWGPKITGEILLLGRIGRPFIQMESWMSTAGQ